MSGMAGEREGRNSRGLIVTADDFGAATAVNEAVEQAHVRGVLTAASLMVGAPAAADAVARAKRLPELRVGLHLVLVEGRPVSDPAAVPDLIGPDGAFRKDMARLGADIFFRPAVRRQMAAEVLAQFEAYAATGLPLDHVNAHKHFHLHPSVLDAMLRIGRRFGLSAVRAPIEPHAVLEAVERTPRPAAAWIAGPWAQACRRRLRRAGVRAPDQVFGLAWSGAMTAPRLAGVIGRLPPGLSEIYLHPAAAEAYLGSAPGYRYLEEFQALVDPEVATVVRRAGLRLGGFADFA
jgi:hopanoid biosynthesis associated protein HpnK